MLISSSKRKTVFSIETLSSRSNPEKLSDRESGVVHFIPEGEIKSFQEFQKRLTEILTSGDPDGLHKTEQRRVRWLSKRRSRIDKDGDEALINLLPENGHRQYTRFINTLERRGEISTISQLLERKESIALIRGISPSGISMKAAELIWRHFEKE